MLKKSLPLQVSPRRWLSKKAFKEAITKVNGVSLKTESVLETIDKSLITNDSNSSTLGRDLKEKISEVMIRYNNRSFFYLVSNYILRINGCLMLLILINRFVFISPSQVLKLPSLAFYIPLSSIAVLLFF